MDWQGLLRRIQAEHPHEPQLLGRCEVAVGNAKEALQILAGHGYHFHLAEGQGAQYPHWPRKLFHVDAAPNGQLVFCEQDAEVLGPGWFDSFQKAQFWDGLETQFNGRGGVAKSPKPPAIPTDLGPGAIFALQKQRDAEALASRAAMIAAFKKLNRWERPTVLEELPAVVLEAEPRAGTPRDKGEALGVQNVA